MSDGTRSEESSARRASREALGHLLGDALDAGAAGDERIDLAALRAFLRQRQREAAVVAVEPVAVAVLHQPGRALRAVEAMAAGAAQRERRVAAAVEEQQRLLLLVQRLGDGGDQRRGQPLALLRRVLAHVDGDDIGQFGARVAAGQRDAAVAPGARVDVALDRRRGRGQHDRELADVGAHHGHVARLVVHAVVLLEAAVVLLVDDDEAELLVGQEQGRAGADDDARLPGGGRAPGPRALGRRERGVPFDRRAAEARREAVHELAGERDLGQHDERLAALLQRAGDRLEIDLGLARAGDAVEQRDGEARPRRRRAWRGRRAPAGR